MAEQVMVEEIFERLVKKVRAYHPSDDLSMIERAYHLSKDAHQEQLRLTSLPFHNEIYTVLYYLPFWLGLFFFNT